MVVGGCGGRKTENQKQEQMMHAVRISCVRFNVSDSSLSFFVFFGRLSDGVGGGGGSQLEY